VGLSAYGGPRRDSFGAIWPVHSPVY